MVTNKMKSLEGAIEMKKGGEHTKERGKTADNERKMKLLSNLHIDICSHAHPRAATVMMALLHFGQ